MHSFKIIPNEEEREQLKVKDWDNQEMIDDMFVEHEPMYYKLDDMCLLFVYTLYYTKEKNEELIKKKLLIQILGDYPYSRFISYPINMINHNIDEAIPPHALFQEFLLWFKTIGIEKIKEDKKRTENIEMNAFKNLSKYVVKK